MLLHSHSKTLGLAYFDPKSILEKKSHFYINQLFIRDAMDFFKQILKMKT